MRSGFVISGNTNFLTELSEVIYPIMMTLTWKKLRYVEIWAFYFQQTVSRQEIEGNGIIETSKEIGREQERHDPR